MNKYGKYILVYLFGFFTAFWLYKTKKNTHTNEDIQILPNGIINISKLVVSEGSFTEINAYNNAKTRLITELSNLYQLSAILSLEVIDETEQQLLDYIFNEKPKF